MAATVAPFLHVPRWLRNAHVQTLGAAAPFFASPRAHALVADELRVPLVSEAHGDGPFALHAKAWWNASPSRRAPLVVVVHGIGGSSESRYVVRAGVAMARAGYHVVRLDLRGAGASVPDAPTLYHAGLTSDVGLVLDHLARDPRVDGLFVLGFSGGGSLALKLAGQWGADVPAAVRGVASISAPLDYTRVGAWMDAPGRFPYRFHVLRGLTVGARTFARLHPTRAHYRPSDVKRLGSFRTYDGTIIAPMHGFRDVDEYYAAASAGPWLSKIEVPSLLVHAEDDPMVPGATLRPWLDRASPAVERALSAHGGHIGWVSGIDEASWISGWAVRQALDFFARLR